MQLFIQEFSTSRDKFVVFKIVVRKLIECCVTRDLKKDKTLNDKKKIFKILYEGAKKKFYFIRNLVLISTFYTRMYIKVRFYSIYLSR